MTTILAPAFVAAPPGYFWLQFHTTGGTPNKAAYGKSRPSRYPVVAWACTRHEQKGGYYHPSSADIVTYGTLTSGGRNEDGSDTEMHQALLLPDGSVHADHSDERVFPDTQSWVLFCIYGHGEEDDQ